MLQYHPWDLLVQLLLGLLGLQLDLEDLLVQVGLFLQSLLEDLLVLEGLALHLEVLEDLLDLGGLFLLEDLEVLSAQLHLVVQEPS